MQGSWQLSMTQPEGQLNFDQVHEHNKQDKKDRPISNTNPNGLIPPSSPVKLVTLSEPVSLRLNL